MRDLLTDIDAWLAQGDAVGLATVVRVVGSAPRPVGARMAAASGGRMAGSVSGGCVEAAVYEGLMDVLAGGRPRLLHFGIPDDMAWQVGLACGGEIDVFLQPLNPVVWAAARERLLAAGPFALVTALQGEATGETAVVTPEGVLAGAASPEAVAQAQAALEARAEGGAAWPLPAGEVYVEPFLPPPLLLILGAVHIAIPLTRFAKELGFRVVVADPRAWFASRERFPEADEVRVEWPDETLAHLPVDASTCIALLTHDPKIDEPALEAALRTAAGYIGAIGSRKTHADRYERMARRGVTAAQLDRVYSPIGLDLGGRTPAETALSIIAEVVAVRHGRRGGSLRG